MLRRFMPREHRFFDLFAQSADLMVEGAREFKALLGDLEHSESRTRAIKDIEHKADKVTHTTMELLHRTFITPLDRGDIYNLIKKLDDVLDLIEAASQRVHIYGIKTTPPLSIELADVCINAVQTLREAVISLEKLKNPAEILKNCVQVHHWEHEADLLLRAAIAKLFREEQDVRTLIKHKELYEHLESVTDRCDAVANIIEGIVLEYA